MCIHSPGWMKKGAQQAGPMWEKAKQVTADTVEATAPARSQFYDLVSDSKGLVYLTSKLLYLL